MKPLTLRDVERLRTAVHEQAGNARTVLEEDRWLELDQKLARIRRDLAGQRCRCGHGRSGHRYATERTSSCRICQCQGFDASELSEPLGQRA